MFQHSKKVLHPVQVERVNPQYAVLLQEQLGGADGELKAALQYLFQSFHVQDTELKELLQVIAVEELSHMEMVAQTIRLLNGYDANTERSSTEETIGQILPGLTNAVGHSWTGDYVAITGDLCADLLSDVASEQRSKVMYAALYNQIHDRKVRETIDFLLSREEAHSAMFREAFNRVQENDPGKKLGAAKMYFSTSGTSPESGFQKIDKERLSLWRMD